MAEVKKEGMAIGESHTVLLANTTFINIRVIDPEGNPLKGHPYLLEMANGKVIKGKLDDDGWAKEPKVLPGTCNFKLVEKHEAIRTNDNDLDHFINIVVKDDEGRPLANEEYTLVLPNGQTKQGVLDEEGRMLEEKIPGGPCFFALKAGKVKKKDVRHLRLQFMDEDGLPFAQKPFEIEVGDQIIEGVTSADGRVIADIPGDLDDGELTIWMDEDKSGESFTWPIKISQVAK